MTDDTNLYGRYDTAFGESPLDNPSNPAFAHSNRGFERLDEVEEELAALASRYTSPSVSAFSGLIAAMRTGQAAGLTVQGDSTGNASDEWPTLFADRLGEHFGYRVLHRLWNDTSQSYDTPTTVVAGTEPYVVPASSVIPTVADTAAISITGDFVIRGKVRATDLDAAGLRTIASIMASTSNMMFRLWLEADGLHMAVRTSISTTITGVVATAVEMAAEFTDGTDFYVGCDVDLTNGSNCVFQALKSTDGITWTTFGTPYSGTAITTLNDSTGSFKIGARNTTDTDIWDGRIYWVELCSGRWNASPKIVSRFDPSFFVRRSSWTGPEGEAWVMGTADSIVLGTPTLHVYNASTAGQSVGYSSDGTRFTAQTLREPHLAIISYGHNESDPTSSYPPIYAALVTAWGSAWPYAPLACTLQNPQVSPRTVTNIGDYKGRVLGIGMVAAANHLEVIDAYTALDVDTATYVDTDGVHPTAAGSQVWADEVWRHVAALVGTAA